jgi:hypothetical protein
MDFVTKARRKPRFFLVRCTSVTGLVRDNVQVGALSRSRFVLYE